MKTWHYILIGFLGLVTLVYINPGNIFMTAFAKLVGEYKTPKYESNQEILEELSRYNVHFDKIYRVRSEKDFDILSKSGLLSMPLIQIYDDKKKLLVTANDDQCSWALSKFFIKGDTVNIIHQDTGMYEFFLEKLEPIQIVSEQDTAEYTVITAWAKFLPKKTMEVFDMLTELNNTHDNISFVSVNLDFREEWEDVK